MIADFQKFTQFIVQWPGTLNAQILSLPGGGN